jgi:hypothetical protein
MKTNHLQINKTVAFRFILTLFAFSCLALNAVARDKMKPEEVVAKHLESIGAVETRASITKRIIAGEVKFKSLRSGGITSQGRAVLASDGLKHLLGMQFDNSDYPFDRFGFDGKNVTVAYIRPGIRSSLGGFFKTYDNILKLGLLGGTLSSSWPLADLSARDIKLDGSGTKKVEGKECYVVELRPKGGSDLTIKLYFDAQTFQHVRTGYERVISARMGNTPEQSARMRETRHTMYEDFSDYRKESGLMLPHAYRIYLAVDGNNGTNEHEWVFTLSRFSFNQKIDPASFNVEGN